MLLAHFLCMDPTLATFISAVNCSSALKSYYLPTLSTNKWVSKQIINPMQNMWWREENSNTYLTTFSFFKIKILSYDTLF